MKRFHKGFFRWFFIIIIFTLAYPAFAAPNASATTGPDFSASKTLQIEQFIKQQMKARRIPGLAMVIVRDNQVIYKNGFGYADVKTRFPVTPNTLFEIGSNSQAFTALGVLRLQEQGLLQLDDPITKHLPWFQVKYAGKEASITIEQLLRQTSGISPTTARDIPISDSAAALENTVKIAAGNVLGHPPGEQFFPAGINYDILGCIIQQISGQSFEKYMEVNVFQPIGLNHTFLSRKEALNHGAYATGYKTGFMKPLEYNAPFYRGNTPSGNYISNIDDLEKWLKLQLGTSDHLLFSKSLIEKTHAPNYRVKPAPDDSYYAMGWNVNQIGEELIFQAGATPNFSSYIELRPGQKLGLALLSNQGDIDAVNIQLAGQGVSALLRDKRPPSLGAGGNQNIDTIASLITYVSALFILATLGFMIYSFIQLFKGERKFQNKGIQGFLRALQAILFLAGLGYCLYSVPEILFPGFDWNYVMVWGPVSVAAAAITFFTGVFLFFSYSLFTSLFVKPDEKPYFTLAVLSIVSGMGNAFLIFTVTAALNVESGRFPLVLFLYFLMAIFIYVFGTRLVRKKMLVITNDIVFQKRMTLVNHILKSSYQKFEQLEGGKIHAGLNNDTEEVSNFATWLIDGLTSLITLICCFLFLGFMNIFAVGISILVFLLSAAFYFYAGRSANRLWEETRSIQNVFFRFINDLIQGFKELALHFRKRDDFVKDLRQTCETYRDKRVAGEIQFINVFIIGELLFVFLIATVVFIFPVLFPGMDKSMLGSYVFIFLYMIGPVVRLLHIIPDFIRFRISWKRINQLLEDLSYIMTAEPPISAFNPINDKLVIELEKVRFEYKSDNRETFTLGPVDLYCQSGEIIFITGGNGSGKSTLGKLLTGLYTPNQGDILINGQKIDPKQISDYYSAVFSDFHLFEKLYGIDYLSKGEMIETYLKILRIDHKLQVKDGKFSTIKLSTGQRKRLALLLSYLEDRPLFLFDEWAADQDAEFREYFYHKLLPELRERGKCIIAITHDDRYFHIADQVIKMEMGQIV